MRFAVMVAGCVLVAGCSSSVGGDAQKPEPTTPTSSAPPSVTRSAPPAPTSPAPTRPPAAGAPVAEVIRWVEAGAAADAGLFHQATRDGATTRLGEDVAFTVPSGQAQCMTDARSGGALACLVNLTAPPPQPTTAYGEWKGGWVDFPGPALDVGSVHGDPGRFSAGVGPELPSGRTLTFGDYRCRSDDTGLFCVNYAHQSAARFSADGIDAYGCLRRVDPPAGVGERFSC